MERHIKYFTCANQIATRYARPGQKIIYYLVSDSNNLLADALAKLGDRVVVSGLGLWSFLLPVRSCANISETVTGIRHLDPHLGIDSSDGSLDLGSATTNAVAEAWTLASTDYKVLTEQSGFGKVATMLRGKVGTTVTIYPEYDEDIIGDAWRKEKGRDNVNCGLDSSLVTFSTLADQWSLG